MRHLILKLVLVGALLLVAGTAWLGTSRSAQATIHEGPIASWCALLAASAGDKILNPPGLSGQSSGKSFARPLEAAGMLMVIPGVPGPNDAVLIPDPDHPAVKAQWNGEFLFPIGDLPLGGTLWLGGVEPDPSFNAFKHCKKLGG